MRTVTVELPITPELVEAVARAIADQKSDARRGPLTPKEFRAAIGDQLSVPTIYRMAQAGELKTVKGLSKVLISASEVERFLS